MSTSAERQRKRRQRLRRQGIVDVTVPVPRAHARALRQFAKRLNDQSSPPVEASRLLEVIGALKSIQPILGEAGIRHAGVFGSTARGEYGSGSDIDILIDVDTKRMGDILGYIEITDRITKTIKAQCPGVEVDVADHATLKPGIRQRVEREVLYAF